MAASGTFAVDAAATFTSVVLINVAPKVKFGTTGQQEVNAAGVPKWSVDVAVTFTPTLAGMAAHSELITLTVTGAGQPGLGLNPGSPVALDGFRVGLNPPEMRDEKIRGGKLWFSASGLRSLAVAQGSRRENAATS